MASGRETILIVDDEVMVRKVILGKLSQIGYRCAEAANAEQALDMMKSVVYELILLDISMPGKSGTELLAEIKAKYSDSAVVMVSGESDVRTAIKAMRAGAYDYIIKPIDLDLLAISVDRALHNRKLVLENKSYHLHLEEKVEEQTKIIRESFVNSIKSLACALEAKDKYTSGHSQRVTDIAVSIAREIHMTWEMIEKIRIAGLVHDIGKIGVREDVLNKAGRLTNEEFEHVKCHSEVGERILRPIIEDEEILEMVRHHHERYDGSGYPDGLSWEQMRLKASLPGSGGGYARILSQSAMALGVADAYDAMTSDRPYRSAMSAEAACAEIARSAGIQFDPKVVRAFLRAGVNLGDKPCASEQRRGKVPAAGLSETPRLQVGD